MNDLVEQLRPSFDADRGYRAAYAESFMNSWVAAQIKVLREQRGLSQQELAQLIGTQQAGISRLENTNYDAWKVQTLARLARAFDVRLRISFEEFGTLPEELERFGREFLKRHPYPDDRVFNEQEAEDSIEDLSDKERRALLGVIEISNGSRKNLAQDGNGNANNLNSFGSNPSIPRDGATQPPRKSVLSESSEGSGQTVPVPQVSVGP